MILTLILMSLPWSAAQIPPSQQAKKPPEVVTLKSEPDVGAKLLQVQRIYVDSFGDDAISKQIQAMVINALAESKRFVITENKDKADAILKGRTVEKSEQELHSSVEATVAGRAAIADASKSTETVHEASLAVRLVASDGDVIWTTTKESKGAKYKGASADVADQVMKQLLSDLAKLTSLSKEKEPPK